jgi:hypothetical protein
VQAPALRLDFVAPDHLFIAFASEDLFVHLPFFKDERHGFQSRSRVGKDIEMKPLVLIAAAGSLAAFAAPASAAEMAPRSNSYEAAAPAFIIASLDQNAQHSKDPPRHAKAYGRRHKDHYDKHSDKANYRDRYDDRYRDRYDDRNAYDRYGRYVEPRQVSRSDRVWQGRDGRYYCERGNGTTGLIIGAAGGALLGREVDRRGDRTLGTVIGAAVGGLIGREIERGRARCR